MITLMFIIHCSRIFCNPEDTQIRKERILFFMDENKNYKDPQREGDDNDTYDPYEEYVKDKVHEEQKEEYGDSYARYTDPQMGPEDDRGRSYKPHHRRATNLEKIGFAMSIAALICCCCANIYLTLGVSIMSLAVLICSRFFANEDHHFHPIAITGIIISSISIVIVAFILFFYLVLYPQLLEDPAYRDMLKQMQDLLNNKANSLLPSESGAVEVPNTVPMPTSNGDTI